MSARLAATALLTERRGPFERLFAGARTPARRRALRPGQSPAEHAEVLAVLIDEPGRAEQSDGRDALALTASSLSADEDGLMAHRALLSRVGGALDERAWQAACEQAARGALTELIAAGRADPAPAALAAEEAGCAEAARQLAARPDCLLLALPDAYLTLAERRARRAGRHGELVELLGADEWLALASELVRHPDELVARVSRALLGAADRLRPAS